MSTVEARKALLEDAAHIVTTDRNIEYGEPEDTFARIATLWSAYLGVTIRDIDVAILMIQMKVARLSANPNSRDSWLDVAGYAACGWGAAVERVTQQAPE